MSATSEQICGFCGASVDVERNIQCTCGARWKTRISWPWRILLIAILLFWFPGHQIMIGALRSSFRQITLIPNTFYNIICPVLFAIGLLAAKRVGYWTHWKKNFNKNSERNVLVRDLWGIDIILDSHPIAIAVMVIITFSAYFGGFYKKRIEPLPYNPDSNPPIKPDGSWLRRPMKMPSKAQQAENLKEEKL